MLSGQAPADRATYAGLRSAVAVHGLVLRGGFHARPGDDLPLAAGRAARTVILVGNAGRDFWRRFAPHADGPDALDHWTVATVAPIAERFGARAVYPFDAPPLPFQRWAMRAGPVAPSPLGILIHPDHGLWHAYRAALLFAEELALPDPDDRPSPCDACAAKPCLRACPVGAFTGERYDVPACADYLSSPAGRDCLDNGCRARAACPVGEPYGPEQTRFHMRAFHRAVAGG